MIGYVYNTNYVTSTISTTCTHQNWGDVWGRGTNCSECDSGIVYIDVNRYEELTREDKPVVKTKAPKPSGERYLVERVGPKPGSWRAPVRLDGRGWG